MAELLIRKAEEKDVEAIANLEILCFSDPWSLESVHRDVAENKLAFYIVAEYEGEIVGYAGLWKIIDEGHITNVAVSPSHRRKHVATALLTVLLQVTGDEGISRHTLEVRAGNKSAIALYEKQNFKVLGVRKGYYRDNGEDALIMWRERDERRQVFNHGI